MLSDFMHAVARLTHQNWLYASLLALIFSGLFITTQKVTREKSLFLQLVLLWVALFVIVTLFREQGGLAALFINPALLGASAVIVGLMNQIYRTITIR
jgi:hypothetical protein